MENIYKPRIDKITNVAKFQKSFKQLPLLPNNLKSIPITDNDIKQAMNFTGTEDEFNNLQDSISIEQHLSSLDDPRVVDYDPTSLKASFRRAQIELQRESLKLNKVQEVLKRVLSPYEKKEQITFQQKLKYLPKPEVTEPPDLAIHDDVVLTISFYEPFRHVPGVRLTYHPKFSQEYVVLGSNYLHELRDKIMCQCNHGPFVDISDNPWDDAKTNSLKTDKNPGFFFITDTFYNDMRNADNADYSRVIVDWTKNEPDIGEVRVKRMEQTRFVDLKFRFGYPHVYQHYGNCEHLFTISSLHLVTHTDCLHRAFYPILVCISKSRFKNCYLCGRCEAAWIVRNSTAQIQDPTFLCNRCFESYHYVDRKKIGKFEAYRYYGSTCIT